ncbi:TetR family transcriptional regulator [Rhodococcus hoagii]|nr:TetR family transcriptional regulator [Prescottella equi]
MLDAAALLFVERGVATTGMADIAKAAGVLAGDAVPVLREPRALPRAFVHREARRSR